MRDFIVYWGDTIFNSTKIIYWWIGLVFTIVGLIPLFSDTWYGEWGRWLILGIGLIIVFIWSPFRVWKQIKDERDRLQAQIDNKESNVELTDFDHQLQYKKMQGSRGDVIVIRLTGRLRNSSPSNYGSLDFLRLEIPTPHGTFIATSDNLPLGHRFEPNSIYPNKLYTFSGELLAPNIGSWEPYIKGAKGRINLQVQGQKIKTYPIEIADKEGF